MNSEFIYLFYLLRWVVGGGVLLLVKNELDELVCDEKKKKLLVPFVATYEKELAHSTSSFI